MWCKCSDLTAAETKGIRVSVMASHRLAATEAVPSPDMSRIPTICSVVVRKSTSDTWIIYFIF